MRKCIEIDRDNHMLAASKYVSDIDDLRAEIERLRKEVVRERENAVAAGMAPRSLIHSEPL
jgi:outer membrane murein-binding lipoprotein Lpp